MCWSIIKQKSAFESRDDREQLEEIGKAIALKCCGVALAANSLGHTLQSMKPSEWESVRDSAIWTVSSIDTSSSQVLASLKLSYSVMPSYLKLCFAYCAIFSKGHKIVKDDLIDQWVSLGFSTPRLGERYISQLLGLSFLEHSKPPSTIKQHEDITFLTMHDLVHDLARSVMGEEIFVVGEGGNAMGIYYQYAILNDCSKSLRSELSKIRALRFTECGQIELRGAAFSSAKSLRVLDLSECSIHKLPDSISVLKQLRYLNAPRIQHAKIPDSITRLSKLIYLNLHGSRAMLALPESIGDIKGLMYLNLSGCSGISKLPESFNRLRELMHLNLSYCSFVGCISAFLSSLTELKSLNLFRCRIIGVLPEALGVLSKLQYLNLSFSSYIECCQEAEFLSTLTELEYLNLSSQRSNLQNLPEAFGRLIQLRYLNLSGCQKLTELPVFFRLKYLQYLNLARTSIFSLPDGLTKLSYLNISALALGRIPEYALDSLIDHICSNLPELEHLDLSGNYDLKSIPECICSLRKLHTLDLSYCIGLQKMPNSVGTIDSLKFVTLIGCPGINKPPQFSSSALSLPHFVVQPANDESSSNLVLLQQTAPVELQLTKLENVMSVREAHCIKLMEKENLEVLKLEWTRDLERVVDDKILLENLVPPSTLNKLKICGYNGVSFPAWVVDHLPNLERLVLGDMAKLEELDTSYSSSRYHVIEELEIHDCPMLRMNPFPVRARYWRISNSDNVLSSWEKCIASQTNDSSSFSWVTTVLYVIHCKVPLQQWRLLEHLPILSFLSIDSCGDLTGSLEIIQHLSSLKSLLLKDKYLEELPKWIGELTSLQFLQIRGWIGQKGLNENIRQLTKLESLVLSSCDNITSLPHWLGQLTSLGKLSIWNCDVFRSFPERIQELTGLQKLEVVNCRELKHIVEPEEQTMKLTHNQEKVCLLPTSLEELRIWKCEGIRSLPEGIQQLTNLRLEIHECPELKQWCELEENQMKLADIKKEFSN